MTRRGRPAQAAPHRIPFHRDRLPGGYPERVAGGADHVAGTTPAGPLAPGCGKTGTGKKRTPRSRTAHLAHVGGTRYGRAALSSELDKVEVAGRGSRHHDLFAAACAVGRIVGGGELDEDQATTALYGMGRRIGLADIDVRRQVDRGIAKGKAEPRKAPDRPLLARSEFIGEIVTWWANLQIAPPLGRRGATLMRMWAAFALGAVAAGQMSVEESYRQIAERAGVSVGTVAKYREMLKPWVRVVHRGNRRTGVPTRWLLVDQGRAVGNNPTHCLPGKAGLFPNARSLLDPSHDYWHRWPCGWRLWTLLAADEAVTVAELARTTGLSVGGVRRSLGRFRSDGLAVRDSDGGWTAVPGAGAGSRDGLDHLAERRARHAKERAAYHDQLARCLADEQANEGAHPSEQRPQAPSGVDVETGEVLRVPDTRPAEVGDLDAARARRAEELAARARARAERAEREQRWLL